MGQRVFLLPLANRPILISWRLEATHNPSPP